MGTGRGSKGPKACSKKKWYKKNVLNVARRAKDLDQIQDEIKALADGRRTLAMFVDEDKPGGGESFCVECSRHFINDVVLDAHKKTKAHKKRCKLVAEEQYTQKEADAGAGCSS